MRSFHLAAAVLLAFSALSISAPNNADPLKRDLLPRQTSRPRPTEGEGEAIVGDATPVTTAEESEETGKSTGKDDGDSKDDAKETGKGDKKSSTKKTKTTRIPADAVAGTIKMVTPDVFAAYPIYKIGDTVTFEWNYTNLIVPPSAINVVAFCSQNAHDFTITGNASAGMTKVFWDTGDYMSTATDKLPVATYTLNIFDAAGSRGDQGEPGHLAPFSGLQFGMYTPRKYKPLKEFVCPTCDPNLASTLNTYTLRMMLGMGLVAASSFIWFMGGMRL